MFKGIRLTCDERVTAKVNSVKGTSKLTSPFLTQKTEEVHVLMQIKNTCGDIYLHRLLKVNFLFWHRF